jgi:hypothetical protein
MARKTFRRKNSRKQLRKSRKQTRKHNKRTRRSNKRSNRRSRVHRGGYVQYLSNVPYSNGRSPSGFCTDNYSHFQGKGFTSPILDGDVKN